MVLRNVRTRVVPNRALQMRDIDTLDSLPPQEPFRYASETAIGELSSD